jgi:hypothetical protein
VFILLYPVRRYQGGAWLESETEACFREFQANMGRFSVAFVTRTRFVTSPGKSGLIDARPRRLGIGTCTSVRAVRDNLICDSEVDEKGPEIGLKKAMGHGEEMLPRLLKVQCGGSRETPRDYLSEYYGRESNHSVFGGLFTWSDTSSGKCYGCEVVQRFDAGHCSRQLRALLLKSLLRLLSMVESVCDAVTDQTLEIGMRQLISCRPVLQSSLHVGVK